jgi:hypothetical protein
MVELHSEFSPVVQPKPKPVSGASVIVSPVRVILVWLLIAMAEPERSRTLKE